MAVSRFRRALGVFHYGPLRRSDWLPTDECEDEQVRPSELSPRDWDSESEDSEEEQGGFGGHCGEGLSDSDGEQPGGLGAHYRSSMAGMAEDSESESSDSDGDEPGGFGAHHGASMGGLGGGSEPESEEDGVSRSDVEGHERESPDDGMGCRLSELEAEPDDEGEGEYRCASPRLLPVHGPVDANGFGYDDDEGLLPADAAFSEFVSEGPAEPDVGPACAGGGGEEPSDGAGGGVSTGDFAPTSPPLRSGLGHGGEDRPAEDADSEPFSEGPAADAVASSGLGPASSLASSAPASAPVLSPRTPAATTCLWGKRHEAKRFRFSSGGSSGPVPDVEAALRRSEEELLSPEKLELPR